MEGLEPPVEVVLELDLEDALAKLEGAEVPSGRIYSIADIVADLHYQARGMIEKHALDVQNLDV